MAHFAKLGLNNEVIGVEVLHNDVLLDADNNEVESIGVGFLTQLHGWALWKQTSYNNNIRKNFAGLGYTYDSVRDAFIAPQPYPSWTFNEDTCRYESPVPYPTEPVDENGVLTSAYIWDEETTTWKEII
jgi:hypothetical protein